ncbi:hypothetical protein [Gemmobacter serpentinus]|uniref:hypothetical protein n=1 Tax=Gemmobacter serpentinus TaxID=2652247 RepID=UPI00124E96CA|nr:hypothetical protein [Gemmobacter serpentinus]
MPRPLDSLSPLQRIRRVRRLVREMQGQRALLQSSLEPRDAADARTRLVEASGDLFAELMWLEGAGIMAAVEECIVTIFGCHRPPVIPSETAF